MALRGHSFCHQWATKAAVPHPLPQVVWRHVKEKTACGSLCFVLCGQITLLQPSIQDKYLLLFMSQRFFYVWAKSRDLIKKGISKPGEEKVDLKLTACVTLMQFTGTKGENVSVLRRKSILLHRLCSAGESAMPVDVQQTQMVGIGLRSGK